MTTIYGLLGIFFFISFVILISAYFSPIARKIGFRNIRRRLGNTALVIIGSMVGSALISGSLVLGDSLDRSFFRIVETNLGELDAQISIKEEQARTGVVPVFTDQEVAQIESLLDKEEYDGVLPMLWMFTSPVKVDAQGEPVINAYNVTLIGAVQEEIEKFGETPLEYSEIKNDGGAIVAESVAKKLELQEGDNIQITYADSLVKLYVQEIVPDEGELGGSILTDNNYLARSLGLVDNKTDHAYSQFAISAKGGIEPDNYDGAEFEKQLKQDLEPYSSQNNSLFVDEAKQAALDGFGLNFFVLTFLALSLFGIIAGILLIINLYSMLAQERKFEMGILRAIALSRSQLSKTFIYEGYLYSVASSLLGTFVGIAIGYGLIEILTSAFSEILSVTDNEGLFEILFDVNADSLVIAFVVGALITIITTTVASYRVSKLNIVSAIRNIPEEPKKPSRIWWWIKTLLLGLFTFWSVSVLGLSYEIQGILEEARVADFGEGQENPFASMTDKDFNDLVDLIKGYLLYVGVVLTILLASWLVGRIVNYFTKKNFNRWILTIATLLVIVLSGFMHESEIIRKALIQDPGVGLFFISSLVLVISLSVLISLNLTLVTNAISFVFGKIPRTAATMKIALRYPAVDRQRTGITLTMFALIIYVIAFISIDKALVTQEFDSLADEALGGYELTVSPNPGTPYDTSVEIREEVASVEGIKKADMITKLNVALPDYLYKDLGDDVYYGNPQAAPQFNDEDIFRTQINFVPQDFIDNATVEISEMGDAYKDEQAVWEAVDTDSSKVVLGIDYLVPGSGPHPELEIGDKIQIADIFGQHPMEKEIIAFVSTNTGTDTGFNSGLITSSKHFDEAFDETYRDSYSFSSILAQFDDGVDTEEVANTVKKETIEYNLNGVFRLRDILGTVQDLINGIFLMLQGFLAFSLIVGTSGLAIIMTRSVQERKQQIGMLRSLGFQRGQILASFFIESTLITFLGIIVGVSMAIVGMNSLLIAQQDLNADFKLTIPWTEILLISLVVYLFSILFALLPSIKASRLSPVEATNYPE